MQWSGRTEHVAHASKGSLLVTYTGSDIQDVKAPPQSARLKSYAKHPVVLSSRITHLTASSPGSIAADLPPGQRQSRRGSHSRST